MSAAAIARSVIAAIEPWYDWGVIEIERMQGLTREHSVIGSVRFFDLQWFGLHIGFQIGRTPKEVQS